MEQTEKANRTATSNDKTTASETPFFARFLEGQHTETQSRAANDGAYRMTLKYPSDRDEDIDPLAHS